jgi:hypothetical protein
LSPETPGKALEDVEEIFMTEAPAWKARVEFIKIVAAEHEVVSDKEAAFRHEDVLPEKNEVEVSKVQQEFKVFTEIAHFPKWEAGAIHLVPRRYMGVLRPSSISRIHILRNFRAFSSIINHL